MERHTDATMSTMECTWSEKISGDRKRAIDELLRGRSFTKQLRSVLLGGVQQESTQDLLAKILRSFTDTLSILNSGESDEVVSQIPASGQLYSPGWHGRRSEESCESGKSSTKDRRGCYKRRKNSQSWIRITPNFYDDGYAWRKYGQKVILNAKHQRSYYRCTHKHDQGCMATKQVQMTEEEPPMYKTTYHGQHTCKSMLKSSQIMVENSTARDSSILLSFESNNQDDSNAFFSSFPLIKQEEEIPNDDQEVTYNNHTNNNNKNNNSSSSDYLLSLELTTFESNLGSDHGDVLSGVNSSCTDSTHSLDDMMMDFDDVLIGFEC
ncbi:putative WRKY transcription factor 70 [Vitis vinifera]|uniref:Putative WRKY transcription factor 70 n=1 Tax=Vitis vinifera TaxID=29760 RepID=A0A438DZI9_VITVI|nr:putative WRKY transcription factor 70 [Vitis vinifera]